MSYPTLRRKEATPEAPTGQESPSEETPPDRSPEPEEAETHSDGGEDTPPAASHPLLRKVRMPWN